MEAVDFTNGSREGLQSGKKANETEGLVAAALPGGTTCPEGKKTWKRNRVTSLWSSNNGEKKRSNTTGGGWGINPHAAINSRNCRRKPRPTPLYPENVEKEKGEKLRGEKTERPGRGSYSEHGVVHASRKNLRMQRERQQHSYIENEKGNRGVVEHHSGSWKRRVKG